MFILSLILLYSVSSALIGLCYLGLQVDVGQRHLGDLIETQRERDGAEDEQRVVDGHTHQHYSLCVGLRLHLHQQSTGQVHQQEDDADAQEEQVQRQPDVCRIQGHTESNTVHACRVIRVYYN